MAGRKFAMISSGLLQSKKVRALKNNDARWAYLCIHFSELSNYQGFFRYQKSSWASDAFVSVKKLNEIILDLETNNLIEYDHDEELVRVIAWFYKANAPANASVMGGHIRDYQRQEPDSTFMFLRSVSEFTVGSIRHAQGWKPESPEWPKLRAAFGPFLEYLFREYGSDLLKSLQTEISKFGKVVEVEIHSIFPTIANWRDKTLEHRVHTVYTHDTETTRDQNLNEKKELDYKPDFEVCSDAAEKPPQSSIPESLNARSSAKPKPSTMASRLAREATGRV
jgi:hypothetical protein